MPRTLLLVLLLTHATLTGSVGLAQERTAKPEKPSRPALPPGVVVESDIVYATRDSGPLSLDVYRPANVTGPLPTIVFIHGGGWKNGDKKSAARNAVWIVPDGYAVVSANYRLTDEAQWPAQVDDCYEAVRWVRKHADQYQFDPGRIAAWGTSAGGHLAAIVGTRPFPGDEAISSRVQAVCDWFGPTDLLTMPPNTVSEKRTIEQVAQSNGAKLLGAAVPTIPERAKDASALYNVSSDDSPTLIMHGSQDPGVPLDQSERFANALREVDVPCVFHVVEGAGHGGPLFLSDESKSVVRTFFNTHLDRHASKQQPIKETD